MTATGAHKYEVLAETLRRLIDTSLAPHDALPSERELMAIHGVSRLTVRAAIAKLVDEGRAYNVQGSGTYAGSAGVVSKTPRLTSFTEDMTGRGHVPSSRVLAASAVAATDALAQRLGVDPGAACTHLRRLRLADGEPMALEDAYLPREVLPVEELDLGGSLYGQLAARDRQVYRAEQEVRAVALDRDAADLLGVPEGSAALSVERVAASRRGRPIEFARTLYRADRYSFQLAVTRESSTT